MQRPRLVTLQDSKVRHKRLFFPYHVHISRNLARRLLFERDIGGYHKKGYPKQEPKMLLQPCKNQSQKTTARSLQNSPIRSRPCAEASYERPKAPRPVEAFSPRPSRRDLLAEALSPRPSRRGPAPKGLGRDANSLIRSRPGSANKLVTSVPTELL